MASVLKETFFDSINTWIDLLSLVIMLQVQLLGCLSGVEMALKDIGYPVKLNLKAQWHGSLYRELNKSTDMFDCH